MADQVPTREHLAETAEALRAFLEITGPRAIPGFERATVHDGWAMAQQADVIGRATSLCHQLFPPNGTPPIGFTLHVTLAGWTPPTHHALGLLFQVVANIMARWKVVPNGRRAFVFGDPDGQVYGVVSDDVPNPPPEEVWVGFPLTVTHDEHAKLTWALDRIGEALGSPPPDPPVGSDAGVCPVRLGRGHREGVRVLLPGGEWSEPQRVNARQFDVLAALVNAFPAVLGKDQLEGICGGARAVFRGLRTHPVVGPAIRRGTGKRGSGYGLVVHHRSTNFPLSDHDL